MEIQRFARKSLISLGVGGLVLGLAAQGQEASASYTEPVSTGFSRDITDTAESVLAQGTCSARIFVFGAQFIDASGDKNINPDDLAVPQAASFGDFDVYVGNRHVGQYSMSVVGNYSEADFTLNTTANGADGKSINGAYEFKLDKDKVRYPFTVACGGTKGLVAGRRLEDPTKIRALVADPAVVLRKVSSVFNEAVARKFGSRSKTGLGETAESAAILAQNKKTAELIAQKLEEEKRTQVAATATPTARTGSPSQTVVASPSVDARSQTPVSINTPATQTAIAATSTAEASRTAVASATSAAQATETAIASATANAPKTPSPTPTQTRVPVNQMNAGERTAVARIDVLGARDVVYLQNATATVAAGGTPDAINTQLAKNLNDGLTAVAVATAVRAGTPIADLPNPLEQPNTSIPVISGIVDGFNWVQCGVRQLPFLPKC